MTKLRLSDAILLGSTLIKLNAGIYLSDYDNCGCLIGMGVKAIGKTGKDILRDGEFVLSDYPWLFKKFQVPDDMHHKCYPIPGFMLIGLMARMIESGTYTFEQALDWIRANEPAEETETEVQPQLMEVANAVKAE